MTKNNFVILDIETNVPENMDGKQHFHVIQIGATKISNGNFNKYKTFNCYIKSKDIPEYPEAGAVLTDFIKKLTKIEQSQVDSGLPFPQAWEQFLSFCSPFFEFFASWGKYDWDVLKRNCDFYHLKWPFRYHVNLKDYFKFCFDKLENQKMGFGVQGATKYFGLPFNSEGAHNALNDAVMITAIAEKMADRGFHTFAKRHYEFKDEKIVPCESSPYLINPVMVKKYKEIQKKAKEMEQFLFQFEKTK